MLIVCLVAVTAAIIAALLGWFAAAGRAVADLARARAKADRAEAELRETRDALTAAREDAGTARVEAARVEAELAAERRRMAELADTERRLGDAFAAVSREALDRNAQSFLELAGTRMAQQQAEARRR